MHNRFKKTILFLFIFCTCLIHSALSFASDPYIEKSLKAISGNQWQDAYDLTMKSKDPLAGKLYAWLLFSKKKGDGHFTGLAQFIRQNPDWPGMSGFKKFAEESMPENLSNEEIVAWFDDYPPKTAVAMDRYAHALIGQGKKDQVKKLLREWWSKTLLTRDEQIGIYNNYKSHIDREAHLKRFDTLLFNRQYTNARAIAGVLGAGYTELAEARIALAEGTSGADTKLAQVPRNLLSDPGLMYERLKWRRKKDLDVSAMDILHNAPPMDKISNPDEWWRERHILVRRMLEDRRFESAYLLASKHGLSDGFSYSQAEWLSGWLALRFMNDPTKALQHFEAMHAKVSSPISVARASYWAGRAASDLGAKDVALRWYEEAAKYQTVFYGQLAGAEIGIKQALPNAAPPVINASVRSGFENHELIKAAMYLHKAGFNRQAGQFLQAFINAMPTPQAYRFSADLSADMGRYYDAVRIAKEATSKGLFLTAQSYPIITNRMRSVDTEWALVHALIRQESMFDFDARSHAGALGLMQLMPTTAQLVAKKENLPYSKYALTSDPNYNIRLGSRYLEDMLARYNGAYPMALAAYNAGPGRVDKWLVTFGDPRAGEIDWIDWMEFIPIYETRNYVQRVMESVYVYRLRLKDLQKRPSYPIHVAYQYR